MYVIESFDPGLWTVGHYDPTNRFVAESDHSTEADAVERVRYLNGGAQEAVLNATSLRDYLAAQALIGILIGHPITGIGMSEASDGFNRLPPADNAARDAYEYADAMIAAQEAR